jgi:SAM-dependent methyltransferase
VTRPDGDLISLDEAIRQLRADPEHAGLVRDAYLGRDVDDSCHRFAASAEWAEVLRLLAGHVRGAAVLDLGAGVGIASAAFRSAGAARVVALEPDASDEVGRGAMARLTHRDFDVVEGRGEEIPLPDGSFDVVYGRQVLHHTTDLPRVLRECARVLKPGGVLLDCREHVVDDEEQLREHLAAHPVHRLAGGEGAYSLAQYVTAIRSAGLSLDRVLRPLDSIVNAFPTFQTQEQVERLPAEKLARKFGRLGRLIALAPPARALVRAHLDKPLPGRMYSFLAHKPRADRRSGFR